MRLLDIQLTLVVFLVMGEWTVSLRAAGGNARAVPTFESLGLYYDRAPAQHGCRVRYRISGASEWRDGYPLVYDQRLEFGHFSGHVLPQSIRFLISLA
jgi:hypothetical protein